MKRQDGGRGLPIERNGAGRGGKKSGEIPQREDPSVDGGQT